MDENEPLINMNYRQYLPYYTLLTLPKCVSQGLFFPFLLKRGDFYFLFVRFKDKLSVKIVEVGPVLLCG